MQSRDQIRLGRIAEFDQGKTPLRFSYYPPTAHNPLHTINAHLGDSAEMMADRVGILQWHPHTGETTLIRVDDNAQHRGIASAMWKEAMAKSAELGVVKPTGSADRTQQGERFFQKQGVELPPLKNNKYQEVNQELFL